MATSTVLPTLAYTASSISTPSASCTPGEVTSDIAHNFNGTACYIPLYANDYSVHDAVTAMQKCCKGQDIVVYHSGCSLYCATDDEDEMIRCWRQHDVAPGQCAEQGPTVTSSASSSATSSATQSVAGSSTPGAATQVQSAVSSKTIFAVGIVVMSGLFGALLV